MVTYACEVTERGDKWRSSIENMAIYICIYINIVAKGRVEILSTIS